jgi:hypothetical protein
VLQNRFTSLLELLEDQIGGGGPPERLGIQVMFLQVVLDGRLQRLDAAEPPRRMRFSVISAKKRSTWFSHEALVGVVDLVLPSMRLRKDTMTTPQAQDYIDEFLTQDTSLGQRREA